MQDKNKADVKEILSALAVHLNVKGIRGLASYLGESESKLYAWVKNGNIGDTGSILGKCPSISLEWLRTGQGPMLTDSRLNQVDIFDQPGEGAISIPDLVKMTIEILESNTVYRPALAANIRAFHQAMAMEEEMQEVKTELQEMRKEHMAELDELKEMIRSLGGVIPEKKALAS